jgi:hypothetical protein
LRTLTVKSETNASLIAAEAEPEALSSAGASD